MAMTLEWDLTVQAPPAQVFARATDLGGFGQWMDGFVRVEPLTPGPAGVGASWREVRRMYGREAGEVFEVTAWDPPRSFTLFVDGTKGAMRRGAMRFTHTFEPVDGGAATRMRMAGEISGFGCMGVLFGWAFKGMFRKAIQKDLAALKRWIEAGAPA
jgi:hypothetical protein